MSRNRIRRMFLILPLVLVSVIFVDLAGVQSSPLRTIVVVLVALMLVSGWDWLTARRRRARRLKARRLT